MEDIDLSGVDPLRWDEARRRVGAVKAFLRLSEPADADRREHAARLGLSVNQFMALVRAWSAHRRAASLAGTGAFRRASRRPNRLSVPKEARGVAERIIDELGADAPFVEVNNSVAAACAARLIPPPSRSTVWNMVAARRQLASFGLTGGGVVVGTCRIRLPVTSADGLTLPSVTLGVRVADGAVLAGAMAPSSFDWPPLLRSLAGADAPMYIDEALLPPGASAAADVTPITSTSARSRLSRALGREPGNVRLLYVGGRTIAPERLLTAKEDRPLSPADASRVAAEAIGRHNAARGAAQPVWLGTIS